MDRLGWSYSSLTYEHHYNHNLHDIKRQRRWLLQPDEHNRNSSGLHIHGDYCHRDSSDMMAKIIQLAILSRATPAPEPEQYQYICEECDGDSFRLLDDGSVWCAERDTEATHLVCGER